VALKGVACREVRTLGTINRRRYLLPPRAKDKKKETPLHMPLVDRYVYFVERRFSYIGRVSLDAVFGNHSQDNKMKRYQENRVVESVLNTHHFFWCCPYQVCLLRGAALQLHRAGVARRGLWQQLP
jgi:hypothetical protein